MKSRITKFLNLLGKLNVVTSRRFKVNVKLNIAYRIKKANVDTLALVFKKSTGRINKARLLALFTLTYFNVVSEPAT